MLYSELNQSLPISKFCFGCEPLGGTDWGDDFEISDIEEAIEIALENGVNFFDTADVYGLGLSEQRLSEILAEKRHDLFIATKGGVSWRQHEDGRAVTGIDCSPSYIKYAVEESLKRLRLDKIPVYYIHWPEKGRDVGEIAETLYELQLAGKIGAIGYSNFSTEQLRRALEFAPISFIQIPVNILMDRPEPDITDFCKTNKIGIVGYNVLASGLLTGKFDRNTAFPSNDRRSRLPQFIGDGLLESVAQVDILRDKAAKDGVTLAQYSIMKALDMPAVEATIIGIKRPKQLKENLLPFK